MVELGSFNDICRQSSLAICPVIGDKLGIEPTCYSRNIEFGGTLIFQACKPPSSCLLLLVLQEPHADRGFSVATLIVHVFSLVMTSIMIYHIKSKFTAIGKDSSVFGQVTLSLCRALLGGRAEGDCAVLLFIHACHPTRLFLDIQHHPGCYTAVSRKSPVVHSQERFRGGCIWTVLLVVHWGVCGSRVRPVLLPAVQRVCRLSIHGGRDGTLALGRFGLFAVPRPY